VDNQYRHSGRITGGGLILGFIFGCLAAAVLSVPYAYATLKIPPELNLLVSGLYGALVGLAVGKGARTGGLEAPWLYAVLGLAAGLVAGYFNWVSWIFAESRQTVVALRPNDIVQIAAMCMKEGTMKDGAWGIPAQALTGFPLLLIWIAEAALIAGFSVGVALSYIRSFLRCPQCRTWFSKPSQTLAYGMPAQPEMLVDELRQLHFRSLFSLPNRTDRRDPAPFLSLELFFCPTCSRFGCFTLKKTRVFVKPDKTGHETIHRKEKVLLRHLLIPVEHLAELLR